MFGGKPLPALVPFFEKDLALSPEDVSPSQEEQNIQIDPPNINKLFLEELGT